ncbi:MAG: LytTR family transcriptional regulator [Paludibacteraceae bacterium]|nr:LytTR family transcriptional regulator [Paludibacteraceae bacterium]
METPKKITSLSSLLTHALVIPVWMLVFYLLYEPAWAMGWLDMGQGKSTFNLLMIMCIVLGVISLSRIIMKAYRKWIPLTWLRYAVWYACEWLAMSLFVGMYMALMYKGEYPYFAAVGRSAVLLFASTIYPYLVINLLFTAIGISEEPKDADDDLLRLYDSTKRLKLVIAAGAIQYIQADENYVIIRYTEGERIKEYTLRNSMKSLEELMQQHGIVRCQRSYYVNPQHVKVLRRDKEGMIVAELDHPDLKPIRVSPKYYDQLSARL